MPANLPSFGELLHSLQETESSFPAIAQGTTSRSERRTSSPKTYNRNGVSGTLPSLSFAANNAQLQATLPRVTRGVRYQPYSSSGSILSRRTSLPHLEYEDSSRVPSICLIKRHKSTVFDDKSRQRAQLSIPVPPPISSLLRGGTRSPDSPSSPISPMISPMGSTQSTTTPPGPVSLPTLPTFCLIQSQSTSQLTAAPMHQQQQPTRLPKLKPIQDRSRISNHSRGSSSTESGSISSVLSMSTDDSGAMGSISSLSGGARSRDTPSISITRPRARSHRVWTASGYRYPPVATAVAQ